MSTKPKIDNSAIPARSNQNLSCNWTGSADFGRLVPIHWEELLPTDKVVRFKPRIEMQMLNLASPTFSKIDLYVHGFVVPIRQIQKTFYDLYSRTGLDKDSNLQYLTPKVFTDIYHDELTQQLERFKSACFKHWTSLGLNPFFTYGATANTRNKDTTTPIWLAPFFAYNKIWWDFYRDPELIRDEEIDMYLFDKDITGVIPSEFTQGEFVLKYLVPHIRSIKNCWIADLFASSGQDFNNPLFGSGMQASDVFGYGSNLNYPKYEGFNDGSFENIIPQSTDLSTEFLSDQEEDTSNNIPNPRISQVYRLIESLTRLSERLSLSGKRQIEALFARYGVKPTWSKMNLARYVGGGKASVLVSDIISTADTGEEGLPLGAKGGAGYCALDNVNIEFSVDEPSIFMVIASVMPHIHFVQGISKKFQRMSLTDMFQSSLQYVGQVGVAKKEIAYKYTPNINYLPDEDDKVFAYSDPYYEYRMGLDILAGDFMKYHDPQIQPITEGQERQIAYMQSMENYIDFPTDRAFEYTNLLVDGDQFNKIFSYLGGSLWYAGDDHFHLCVDKEFIINRPMEGFAIPTLETTQDPHQKKVPLSSDTML